MALQMESEPKSEGGFTPPEEGKIIREGQAKILFKQFVRKKKTKEVGQVHFSESGVGGLLQSGSGVQP